jgi:putative Holliday junction resolvase
MRILGIDPGERRVGIAVSDPLAIVAQGLETFDAKDGGDLVEHLRSLVERYGVEEIVVGNPVGLSGKAGEASAKASDLARRLRERLAVRVTLWDERLSTREASRVLRGERAGKAAVDKLAAVIILQSYLDYLRRSQ